LNIRQIENLDPKSILRGNVKDLLAVMNDLAYVDIENDEYIGGSEEAKKLYKLSQYGLQYMIHTVSKLGDNGLLLRDYLQIQEDKRQKLLELVSQQEETLKSLRQKKKLLNETEKNYQNLIQTLNIEGEVGQLNQGPGRSATYESEPENYVPLNLPKGPRRGSGKSQQNSATATEPSRNIQIIDQGTQSSNFQQQQQQAWGEPQSQNQAQTQSNPSRLNRPGTSYGLNNNEPENAGRFKVQNQEQPSRDEGNRDPYSKWNTVGYNNTQVAQNEDEKIDEETSNLGASRYENKPKKNNDDDDDEYKDDFELSESLMPDNSSKLPSRLSNYRQPQAKKNEQHLEETISMDFDKEFNTKNYVEGLDRYVNKNSPNVEFSVKKY